MMVSVFLPQDIQKSVSWSTTSQIFIVTQDFALKFKFHLLGQHKNQVFGGKIMTTKINSQDLTAFTMNDCEIFL